MTLWARSEVGLSRLPVTEEIAGSNPVGPANKIPLLFWINPEHILELSTANKAVFVMIST